MGLGLVLGMDEIGTMTLSSSSLWRTGSNIGGVVVGMLVGVGGVIVGATGGEVVGVVVGLWIGLRREERRVGSLGGACWAGGLARPGVLFRVTPLCVRGVVLTVCGAVGLLESVASTLGGAGSWGSSTLGACWPIQ
jgi:hypothetical protein